MHVWRRRPALPERALQSLGIKMGDRRAAAHGQTVGFGFPIMYFA